MKIRDIGVIFSLVLIDLVTKSWVASQLRLYQSIEVIPNFFAITYTRNTGAAWSILAGQMTFFYIVTAIALIVLVRLLMQVKPTVNCQRVAFWLLIAGTLGNFYDRLVFQYVRDFLDFMIIGYDFPVFNVADTLLTIGVALLILDMIFGPKEAH